MYICIYLYIYKVPGYVSQDAGGFDIYQKHISYNIFEYAWNMLWTHNKWFYKTTNGKFI